MSEKVKFYSWIEKVPSSLVIRIDGGEMSHTGGGENDKMSIKTTLKEVRFNKGLLLVDSDDKQTLRVLRGMIAAGDNITEDHELYLSKITTPEEQAKRSGKKVEAAVEENKAIREENERLKKQLAKRDSKLGKADKEPETAAVA